MSPEPTSLLLTLLSEGLIDDVEDDNSQSPFLGWTQGKRYESVEITLVCHGTNGSFDEDEETVKGKRVSLAQPEDCSTYRHSWYVLFMRDFFILICTHIRSSATRIVHQLVDGSISIDRARCTLRTCGPCGSFSS